MTKLNPVIEKTAENNRKRSHKSRANYVERITMIEVNLDGSRGMTGCLNLAHAVAGATFCPTDSIIAKTAMDWLSLPNVQGVGGTCVAPKDLLAKGYF